MIKLGEYNQLTVVRKSDLGYMLTDGNEEVLLHYRESKCEHNINDSLNVFIYSDKAKRPTATENDPLCTLEKYGICEVVEVFSGMGVFVNINTPKDILVSNDYLPYNEKDWPGVGDKLLIQLKIKHNYLVGKPLNRFDIVAIKSNVIYGEYEHVDGFVVRIAEKGIGIATKDLMYVFVPNTQLRGDYHMGQEVNVMITKALDGEYYGSLIEQKENMIDGDKEIILNYLNNHHGVMKLTAKSSSNDVLDTLKLSRKAFKRAYGGLYKDHLIEFDEEKTYLVKK